ncbi:probable nuclear transport factor 2 isoform X2 [Neocloeon triangulifer]|uniref:probable nuclear transport factor 2 isoform X2 n=1 Tax=Neocloeon triangulifer TaxID=2078957 RepID=UPI00286F80A8|nr:probable nuclear transport factor 2 isoform X2 [Neocloeon triangulifer]
MNPNFEEIGREFVKQYYSLFDNQDTRLGMAVFYNTLGFKNINRVITTVDSQPMLDGGVLISVLGRLQCDEDPPHEFTQIFILQAIQGSFVLMHDIFRLGLHDLP